VETALERELSQVIVGAAPHWIRLRKGATLVAQGDPGHELYLLFDGVLAVEIDGVTVTELGPGAVVGEVALLEGGPAEPPPCGPSPAAGSRPSPGPDRPAALAELARTRGWPGPDPPGDHPGGPPDPPDPPGNPPGPGDDPA
jgi:hypothetical protein